MRAREIAVAGAASTPGTATRTPYHAQVAGLTAARMLPDALADVGSLEIAITRDQPRVTASTSVSLAGLGAQDFEVQTSLEAETGIRRQVFALMKRGLPGCVLRRKMELFFSDVNGYDSPLVIRCVLVIHASGALSLRMDLRHFDVVDDDTTACEVKTAVNSIYKATFV